MTTPEDKTWISQDAWHGGRPYTPDEMIRIVRACELIREEAGRLPPGRRFELLDIGCGVGPLREFLPAEGFCIRGLEFCREAAELAAQRYDSCQVADVESPWPVPPASFDGVHAGAILEHVPNWHAPLNHANRVLRDGGLLVLSVPNLAYWKERRRLLMGKQPHWVRDMEHLHAYTPAFLRELVALHGFEPAGMEADRVNLPCIPNSRWVRRVFARIGSVLILWARLSRRVRVENAALAGSFPKSKPVGLRSIEAMES